MEGTAVHHVICILSISFLLTCIAAGKPNGLSVELIHIYSPASPLYPGNISFEEEIHRLIDRSNLRAHHIDATIAPSPTMYHKLHTTLSVIWSFINSNITLRPFTLWQLALALSTRVFEQDHSNHTTCMLTLEANSCGHCEDYHKHQCFPTEQPPFPIYKKFLKYDILRVF